MTQLISDIIIEMFEKHKDKTAFIDCKTGYKTTFFEVKNQTYKIIKLIQSINQLEQKNIVINIRPSSICYTVDFAILLSNNVSVMCDFTYTNAEIVSAIDYTNSDIIFTDNINFIENYAKEKENNKNRTIFYVGEKKNIDVETCNNIKVLCLFKELADIADVSDVILPKIYPNSYATIFFSSGTIDKPKGVVYSHKKLTAAYFSHRRPYIFKEYGGCLTMLSSSHLCPRLCDIMMLEKGFYVIFTDYIKYKTDIKNYQPKYLLCVPKLLSLHLDDYFKKLSEKNRIFRFIHNLLYDLSVKYIEHRNKTNLNLINTLVLFFQKICNTIGKKYFFDNILKSINFPTDVNILAFGAFIDCKLETFYSIIGEDLLINYGLTEGATITYTDFKNKKIGSVGKISPDVSLKICNPDTGENLSLNTTGLIKIKGEQTMLEYYKDEEKTKEVFDKDGYLSTGDMGFLTEGNFLFFKGRYKSAIILNNGENINPEGLEELCKQSDFVSQIIIAGQDKPYLTAIIVLNKNYVNEWLKTNEKDKLKKTIIIDINNKLGSSKFFKWTHQIKNAFLTEEPFTQENGLLNKKLGLNRFAIYQKYANVIEELYKYE